MRLASYGAGALLVLAVGACAGEPGSESEQSEPGVAAQPSHDIPADKPRAGVIPPRDPAAASPQGDGEGDGENDGGDDGNGQATADLVRTAPTELCARPALIFADGRASGHVCAEEARQRGLTIIDLSDEWTPVIFEEDLSLGDVGKQPYAAIYRALAHEELGSGPTWRAAHADRFYELYGIPPTVSVLRRRMLDAGERHECHVAVSSSSDALLAAMSETVREERASVGRKRIRQLGALERALEQQRVRRELASLDELASVNKYYARQVARYRRMRATVGGIKAVQGHLLCEGLLDSRKKTDGIYEWRTAIAVGLFQRRNMLMADQSLGEHTRAAFLLDPREHHLRSALRVLRERVVSATGLIEDGSAREEWSPVLGRYIDSSNFREPTGKQVPEHGAPDLISSFTEKAARALGWTDYESLHGFLDSHGEADRPMALRVAVALPPLPSYHNAHMELRAVIDRGDVNYDFPRGSSRGCRAFRGKRLPTLTLYARDGDREIALVRWHTTIGGWNRERMPGGWEAMRYKESDVGPRVWRDMVVAPSWFPPPSTPDADLVMRTDRGREIKYDTLGPSYRSAYGLVMMIHHQVVQRASGPAFYDNGIRTHGSANYLSIIHGCSHGCHRLFNHQAVRLAAFLLAHRPFVRNGQIAQVYGRRVRVGNRVEYVQLDSRGYGIELTPPVPIEVTRGNIIGRLRTPIRGARPIHVPRKAPEATEATEGTEGTEATEGNVADDGSPSSLPATPSELP